MDGNANLEELIKKNYYKPADLIDKSLLLLMLVHRWQHVSTIFKERLVIKLYFSIKRSLLVVIPHFFFVLFCLYALIEIRDNYSQAIKLVMVDLISCTHNLYL